MKKIFLITGFLSLAINLSAQTQTENYVLSTSYLTEDKSKKIQSVEYIDGLGRPKQNIAIKANPSGKDMVIPMEYDNNGRKTKNYLPLPVNSLNGNIQPIDGSSINSYYGVTNAYSEIVLDESPLNRIKQSAFPGDAWIKNAGHTMQYGYDTNSTADGAIKKYITPSNAYTFYADNELYKFQTKDEDGNEVHTFKDKQGHTVLERKINIKLEDNSLQRIDTYYVYNKYGQLRYIIPPEAAAIASMHYGNQRDLCYEYEYDNKNRLTKKKLPGKNEEYMVYDKQNRLIFYQDANLASATNSFGAKGWLFTKYDQFDRVVYTGFVASNDVASVIQNIVDTSSNATNNESKTGTFTNYNGLDLYYTNNAFPTVITKLLTVNYYDTYPVGTPSIASPILGQTILGDNAQSSSISTKGFVTASFVKNIADDKWTKTYRWYDNKGRTIVTQTSNHLNGFTKTENQLDFAGLIKKRVTKHSRSSVTTPTVTVEETFTYNPQNFLTKYEHEVVGRSPKETLAEYSYNDLGQIIEKKVGGQGVPLQTVNYKYNIRGWLTDINDIDNADNTDDLFAYKIRYNEQRKGLEIPNVTYPNYKVKQRYNGNIAEVDWYVKDEVTSDQPYRYGYVYDNLDRLKAGFYQNPANRSRGDNHEIVENYDLNGNIVNLKRFARKPKSTVPAKIDDLTYTYGGNRVTKITDASANASGYEGGGGAISYDSNGNMTAMADKGITNISYNYLNLPVTVDQRGNETQYTYRADGTKLKRAFTLNNTAGSTTTTTEYLGGFQYVPGSIIAMGKALQETDDTTQTVKTAGQEEIFLDSRLDTSAAAPQPQLTMALSFFPTAEGFYDYQKKQYIYQYKDQVGNIRLSYAKNPDTNEIDVLDRNDYYPFGMNFVQGSEFSVVSSPLNYKFQEQELQETGWYSFKWRNYDPTIGRFFNVDPLSEKYAYQSHYNFSENRVVNSREIEGLESFDNWDDPYEWGDKVGLDRDSYSVEWQDNGRSEIVQNIEEVVITADKHDFWDDLMSYFNDFDFHNEDENLFNFSGGTNEPDLEDRYRQGDATVERSDLFEWLSMGYGWKGSGFEPKFEWMERLGDAGDGLSIIADLMEKLEGDGGKSDHKPEKEMHEFHINYDYEYDEGKGFMINKDTVLDAPVLGQDYVGHYESIRAVEDSIIKELEK